MGNIFRKNEDDNKDYEKIKANGVYVFYKPKRSKHFYVGVVYIGDIKIKKKFYNKENAEEWVKETEKIQFDENVLNLLAGVEFRNMKE